ncbi:hypothetical protein QQ045_008447 [Rhodiola kirilowii]
MKNCKDSLKLIVSTFFKGTKSWQSIYGHWSSDEAPVKHTAKELKPKNEIEEDEDEDEPKKKGKRQGNSGFLAHVKMYDALVQFLGTGESELSRSEVVKRIWNYMKENSLQVSSYAII